jgi:hypothetical protein
LAPGREREREREQFDEPNALRRRRKEEEGGGGAMNDSYLPLIP